MTALLGWILAGLVVGAVARFLLPGRQPMGCMMTIISGIAGALLGSAVSYAIWGLPDQAFAWNSWPGYPFAILGTLFLLWIAGATERRTPR